MTKTILMETFGDTLRKMWEDFTAKNPEIVTLDEMTFEDFVDEVSLELSE